MTEPLVTTPNPIALALGGGGARGIAHIGIFKVLQEEGVPFDMIVGTSIGAMGAALWGLEPDWKWARDRIFVSLRKKGFAKYGKGLTDSATGAAKHGFFKRAKLFFMKFAALQVLLARKSLVSRRRLSGAIASIVPDKTFADLKVPAAAVALDLKTGTEVVIREGSLRDAVVASASLAGFFPPVQWGEGLLVDASPVSSVPVDAARRLGAAGVIGFDIRSRVMPTDKISSGADAVFRIAAIASERTNDDQASRADVSISPAVGDTYWSDFHNLEAHVEAGERAAREKLGEVREMLARLGRE